MNSIADAQQDMRDAYYSGVPGIISSGTAWLIAALVVLLVGRTQGILTLVIGGMFIWPVSVLLSKAFRCSGKHRKGNPLAALAIEGTFWMLLSIPVAAGAAMYRIQWFFPAMLLVIGGRYLTFSTLYGLRTYWLFGAALILAGIGVMVFRGTVFSGALSGALVEYAFAALLFVQHRAARRAETQA